MCDIVQPVSIIIPASNEEGYIEECLYSLLSSEKIESAIEVIIAVNGCTDNTLYLATQMINQFHERGWLVQIIELVDGGKYNALNKAEEIATHNNRIYLDADIRISSNLIYEVSRLLSKDEPVYASGTIVVPKPESLISEIYARFWTKLPFIKDGVAGCGLFAVNEIARNRWSEFPKLISDDTFVRYHFKDDEMHKTNATYEWPITEGFRNLIRVRRRQNHGISEIRQNFPELSNNVSPTKPKISRIVQLFVNDPTGFLVYVTVGFFVKLPIFRSSAYWYRGR